MTRELEQAIAELVDEYERLHCCEVSSVWVEHLLEPPLVQVKVTVRPPMVIA